jgi:hypothetical protein
MRLTTISRQMNEMIEKINSIKKLQSMSVIDQMNSYTCRIKDIQKQNLIVSLLLLLLYFNFILIIFCSSREIQKINLS